jgi:hypothetical protein
MEIRYQQTNPGASDEDGAPSDETRRPWAHQPIGEVGVDITRGRGGTLRVRPAADLHPDAETVHHVARLLPHAAGDVGGAVLVLPSRGSAILVNGFPPLAVSELPDGAELSIGADSLFYQSSERAEIESFAAGGIEGESEGAGECARCNRPLEEGDVILRCSHCGSPHHEGATVNPRLPDLSCASYDPSCARCNQPLGTATFPEDEEHVR